MFDESRLPYLKSCFHEFDEPVSESIVDDLFVFMNHNRAS